MFVIALFIISKKPEAITMFFNGGIGKLCREGGINRQFGMNRYTLLYIQQINNKELLNNTGNCIQYLIIL